MLWLSSLRYEGSTLQQRHYYRTGTLPLKRHCYNMCVRVDLKAVLRFSYCLILSLCPNPLLGVASQFATAFKLHFFIASSFFIPKCTYLNYQMYLLKVPTNLLHIYGIKNSQIVFWVQFLNLQLLLNCIFRRVLWLSTFECIRFMRYD